MLKRIDKFAVSVLIMVAMLMLGGCGKSSEQVALIDSLPEIDFDTDYPVGPITPGITITQSFVSGCDEITDFELYGATYKRQNTAILEVRLMVLEEAGQTEGAELAHFTIDSSKMEDNAVITFALNADKENSSCIIDSNIDATLNKKLMNRPCLIEITTSDGIPDECPTLWMTEENIYDDGAFGMDGYEMYNDLWFQVNGMR